LPSNVNTMKKLLSIFMMCWLTCQLFANPITGMLERIDKGASKKFAIELKSIGDKDYFDHPRDICKQVTVRHAFFVWIRVVVFGFLFVHFVKLKSLVVQGSPRKEGLWFLSHTDTCLIVVR